MKSTLRRVTTEHQLGIGGGVGTLAGRAGRSGLAGFVVGVAVAFVVTVLGRAAAVEVPFAEMGGGVAGRFQRVADGGEAEVALRLRLEQRARGVLPAREILHGAVGFFAETAVAAVEVPGGHHAGLDRAAGRAAHAGGGVGVAKRHALRGEFFHVGHVAEGHRRFRQIGAHAHRCAEPRHIVDEDEDDIGRGRRDGRRRARASPVCRG
jgi:hypothetical protein